MPKAKLSPSVHKRIVDQIMVGNHTSTAAKIVKVSPQSINSWLRQGREELARIERGGSPDPLKQKYARFYEDVEEAHAMVESKAVGMILDAGSYDWKAPLAYLERKDPKKWGLRINMTLEQEFEKAITKLEIALTPEEFEKVLTVLATPDELVLPMEEPKKLV